MSFSSESMIYSNESYIWTQHNSRVVMKLVVLPIFAIYVMHTSSVVIEHFTVNSLLIGEKNYGHQVQNTHFLPILEFKITFSMLLSMFKWCFWLCYCYLHFNENDKPITFCLLNFVYDVAARSYIWAKYWTFASGSYLKSELDLILMKNSII